MFTDALFVIVDIQKQPKGPCNREMNTDDEYIQHTRTVEYYSAIQKNEVLPFVATGMDLESNMLSEIS